MATSTVRGSVSIFAMSQGDTLQVNLQTDGKALVQYINNGVATPDWTVPANSPKIYPRVLSTLTTGIVTAVSNARWYYDGVLIAAGNPNFTFTTYTVASVAIPALEIKSNIMLSATSSKVIRGVFDVVTGGILTEVQASVEVQRKDQVESAHNGQIVATNGGAIDSTVTSIQVKATLFTGGIEDPDYTVQWWKLVANDVDGTPDGQTNTGKTTKTITLGKTDIDVQETYIAKFFKAGSQVAIEFITLFDNTDPYQINFSTVPFKVPVGGSSVTTVNVVLQGTSTNAPGFTKFSFALMKGATQVRTQVLGGKTFTTNFADFTGTDQLLLNVETTQD